MAKSGGIVSVLYTVNYLGAARVLISGAARGVALWLVSAGFFALFHPHPTQCQEKAS